MKVVQHNILLTIACVAGGIVYQSSEIWRSREKNASSPLLFLDRGSAAKTLPPAAQAIEIEGPGEEVAEV